MVDACSQCCVTPLIFVCYMVVFVKGGKLSLHRVRGMLVDDGARASISASQFDALRGMVLCAGDHIAWVLSASKCFLFFLYRFS
jgi:hypothetical protein